ncbi:MAG: hypothetical protein RMI04_09595, partial [Thermofilaceae archaeon]|nr:hypothetical protein [Thermofilaceae archaeon]
MPTLHTLTATGKELKVRLHVAASRRQEYPFNSFPVAVRSGEKENVSESGEKAFNSFPVAVNATKTQHIEESLTFNSFPVAVAATSQRCIALTIHLSILSQLHHETRGTGPVVSNTFNSFPVASSRYEA